MEEFNSELLKEIDFKGIAIPRFVDDVLNNGVGRIKKIFQSESKGLELQIKKKLSKKEFDDFVQSYKLEVAEVLVLKSFIHNLKSADLWSKETSFNFSKKLKKLENIFVDIDLYLSPLKNRIDVTEVVDSIKSSQIDKYLNRNMLIYGGPGAGKTTLMKDICRKFLFHDGFDEFTCLIVIRFRELDYSNNIDKDGKELNLFQILLNVFNITISIPEHFTDALGQQYSNLIKLAVIDFIEKSNLLILFDGFDEIPNNETKKIIERDFETLSLSLKKSRFIITSRTGEFKIRLGNTDTFEICPLRDFQIQELAEKWLDNKKDAKDLYLKIKDSPYYDTTIRPLTISHLCAIYERRKTIPAKPRYIYDLVIQLLLELWDEERGINRPSLYADFYIEKKKEFLAHLSFCFSFDFKSTIFNSDDLRKCYNRIYKVHNLPSSQAKKIINEIESHSGILVQNGYDSVGSPFSVRL